MRKGLALTFALALAATAVFAQGTQEEAFPDPEKTITIVCPQAAGGGTDKIFRALAEQMKAVSGANVVVTNITGAGTATGTNEVLNGEADGYTLLAGGTHTISATMQGLTDGYTKLDCIAGLNEDPFIVATIKGKPYATMQELVEYAKAHPGEVSLGNAGMGGATGVASVGINLAFDKSFNVTPFNGGADLRTNVLGGHCDVGIFSQSEVIANKDQMIPLAILTEEHSTLADLKSVPTLKECGYDITIPGYSFRSVMCKAGTPSSIEKWLADTIDKAYHTEAYQKFQEDNGLIQVFTKLDDYKKFQDEIIAQYTPILKEAGMYKMQ